MLGVTKFAKRERSQRGNALVEFSLLAPWLLFLFVGVFDMGFYTYSMTAVENAARVAAEFTSSSPTNATKTAVACTRVLGELSMLPNMKNVSSCTCSPLELNVASGAGPDSLPATSVTVTYSGVRLIPIPGLLTGQLNFSRTVQMRIKP